MILSQRDPGGKVIAVVIVGDHQPLRHRRDGAPEDPGDVPRRPQLGRMEIGPDPAPVRTGLFAPRCPEPIRNHQLADAVAGSAKRANLGGA